MDHDISFIVDCIKIASDDITGKIASLQAEDYTLDQYRDFVHSYLKKEGLLYLGTGADEDLQGDAGEYFGFTQSLMVAQAFLTDPRLESGVGFENTYVFAGDRPKLASTLNDIARFEAVEFFAMREMKRWCDSRRRRSMSSTYPEFMVAAHTYLVSKSALSKHHDEIRMEKLANIVSNHVADKLKIEKDFRLVVRDMNKHARPDYSSLLAEALRQAYPAFSERIL